MIKKKETVIEDNIIFISSKTSNPLIWTSVWDLLFKKKTYNFKMSTIKILLGKHTMFNLLCLTFLNKNPTID